MITRVLVSGYCTYEQSYMASKKYYCRPYKTKKLDGLNYDTWHHKIQYLLNNQETLETLTNNLENLEMVT